MTNVIAHPKTAEALRKMRFLQPTELRDELTLHLAAKMEALADEAYLEGRRRGFAEGWLNGATIALALCLLAFALGQLNVAGNIWQLLFSIANDRL